MLKIQFAPKSHNQASCLTEASRDWFLLVPNSDSAMGTGSISCNLGNIEACAKATAQRG